MHQYASQVRRVVPDEIGESVITIKKYLLPAPSINVIIVFIIPSDNIDEMMTQFEGREDELIETLRTMQERNVAQRARAAVQKTAKLEAKARATMASSASSHSSNVLRPRGDASSSEPSHYGASDRSSFDNSLDNSVASSVSDMGMSSIGESRASRSTQSSLLELAIEKGDWRAVGEAAAMMGGYGTHGIPTRQAATAA